MSKSLVSFDDQSGRYHLLETVRQYSGARLEDAGEVDRLRRDHVLHYLSVAEEAEPFLWQPDNRLPWHDLLIVEKDNEHAALDYCKQTKDLRDCGLRIAAALWRFYYDRARVTEGWNVLMSALACDSGSEPSARANALLGAGCIAYLMGDYEQSKELLLESLAIYRAAGDLRGEAFTLNNLGASEYGLGNIASAKELFELSLDQFRFLGHKWGTAQLLNCLGELARYEGDYAQARALYEESMNVCGDAAAETEINLFSNLGNVQLHEGDHAAAAEQFALSITAGRRLANVRPIVNGLTGLAGVNLATNDPKMAAILLGSADGVRESAGMKFEPMDARDYESRMEDARGRLDPAEFNSLWQKGRAMTLDEAVTYALGNSHN